MTSVSLAQSQVLLVPWKTRGAGGCGRVWQGSSLAGTLDEESSCTVAAATKRNRVERCRRLDEDSGFCSVQLVGSYPTR